MESVDDQMTELQRKYQILEDELTAIHRRYDVGDQELPADIKERYDRIKKLQRARSLEMDRLINAGAPPTEAEVEYEFRAMDLCRRYHAEPTPGVLAEIESAIIGRPPGRRCDRIADGMLHVAMTLDPLERYGKPILSSPRWPEVAASMAGVCLVRGPAHFQRREYLREFSSRFDFAGLRHQDFGAGNLRLHP
jgi:hypothetical protein